MGIAKGWHHQTSATGSGIEENEYTVQLMCGNCSDSIYIAVRRGVQIQDILSAVSCEHCGCRCAIS